MPEGVEFELKGEVSERDKDGFMIDSVQPQLHSDDGEVNNKK